MHCSNLLIAFQEIQNFSNRSKFICSEDCFVTSNTSEAAPSFPPAQPRVTNTCRVRQETKGTEHRDNTWLQGWVKEAARVSTGTIQDRQCEGGRGWAPAARGCGQPATSTAWSAWKTGHSTLSASQGLQQPHLTCLRTLTTPQDVPEGRGQEDCFSGTCHSVPSSASNGSSQHPSQNQGAKPPETKVLARGFSAGGTSVFI